MINHALTLDMRKSGVIRPRLTVRLGESRTQKVVAALTDGGAPYSPDCDSARLLARMDGGALMEAEAAVSRSSATATLPVGTLGASGRSRVAYFEFAWEDGLTETTEDFELVVLESAGAA